MNFVKKIQNSEKFYIYPMYNKNLMDLYYRRTHTNNGKIYKINNICIFDDNKSTICTINNINIIDCNKDFL